MGVEGGGGGTKSRTTNVGNSIFSKIMGNSVGNVQAYGVVEVLCRCSLVEFSWVKNTSTHITIRNGNNSLYFCNFHLSFALV
jgi:hypothetical protein